MGLQVVCEGVETVEQQQVLIGMGARYAQGWLFGRPLDEEAAVARLRTQAQVPQARQPTHERIGDPRQAPGPRPGAGAPGDVSAQSRS